MLSDQNPRFQSFFALLFYPTVLTSLPPHGVFELPMA